MITEELGGGRYPEWYPRTPREQQLLDAIPNILDFDSLLYIGAQPISEVSLRIQMLRLFEAENYEVQIMEIWEPFVEGLRSRFPNIIQGDIRDLNIPEADVVMWWHGPEHVKKEELPIILSTLYKNARKCAVVSSPWGIHKQGEFCGNPYEEHLCTLYPSFFENLGWETSVIGQKDVRGNNLLAWRNK